MMAPHFLFDFFMIIFLFTSTRETPGNLIWRPGLPGKGGKLSAEEAKTFGRTIVVFHSYHLFTDTLHVLYDKAEGNKSFDSHGHESELF